MKVSEERQIKAYTAISKPITQLRIELLRKGNSCTLDNKLMELEIQIWRNLVDALNIEGGFK